MILSKRQPLSLFAAALIGLLLSTQTLAIESTSIDARVRTLADRWLSLLDAQQIDSAAYAPLLDSVGNRLDSPLDLTLLEGSVTSLAELKQKLQRRFVNVLNSQHRIDFLTVKPQQQGLYQVVMEVDWQLLGHDGLQQIARLDLRWLVRQASDGSVRIVQIRERYLPPLQGMGARIQC